ncbi:hypothetical protein PG987_007599 [Apiospora arundinis]
MTGIIKFIKGRRALSYLHQHGGNIIFASGGERLFKLAQSSATGTKVWRVQDIALAVPLAEKALVFSSYTTTLHVSDLQDLPAEDGVELEISADALAPFYINGLYYLMGPKPVRVLTNSAGLVNVVEAAAGLNATVLTVFIRHEPTSNITNPMQKAFDKLAALGSETALRAALIAVSTTAGGMAGADPKHKPRRALGQRGGPEEYHRQNGVEAVFEFTQDAATTTWHFIAKIAGKVYRAVLGTVEAIVGAIEWVFEQIKTWIETLIHLMTLCLRHQMDQLGAAKTAFDGQVGEVLQSHGYVMLGMYSDLKSLAPKITQMSVTEILKAFGALLADGMLISTQAVLDALLDTLVSIGTPWFSGLGDARATGAVLIVPQLFVTGWHFYELSQTVGGRRGGPAHTAAVLGEVARLTGYASAICSAAALLMTLILSGMVDSRGPASTLQTSSRSSMATLLI